MMRPGKNVASLSGPGLTNMCDAANMQDTIVILRSGRNERENSVCIQPLKNVSSIIAAAIPEARNESVSFIGKKCGTRAPGQYMAIGVRGTSVSVARRRHSRSASGVNVQTRPYSERGSFRIWHQTYGK